MKDKVFIAWSGKKDIAKKLTQKLEKNGYISIIGGNDNNTSEYSSVSDTVITQIRQCDQAIVIMQNKDDGMISGNVLFELGLAYAYYGPQRVHCVRRFEENIDLPSDFGGAFLEPIKDTNGDDLCFAEGISRYFLERQKINIEGDKLKLMSNRDEIHNMIKRHYSDKGSLVSDYKLAQYLLFYVEAAYIFGDDSKVYDELTLFSKSYFNENDKKYLSELSLSINVCLSSLKLFIEAKELNKVNNLYISEQLCKDMEYEFKAYLNDLKLKELKDEKSYFYHHIKAYILDKISYSYFLCSQNDLLSDNERKNYLSKAIEAGNVTISEIEALRKICETQNLKENDSYLDLFYSYNTRLLYTCYYQKGNLKEAKKHLRDTIELREKIARGYRIDYLDPFVYSNLYMELYLSLTEYWSYFGTNDNFIESKYFYYKDKINDFLQYLNKLTKISNPYVEKIEKFMDDFD